MKDKKLILTAVCAILALLVVAGGFYFKKDKEEVPKPSADALKFKEEYESLNNTVRESDGAKYNNVIVKENNPIKYVDSKGALEVLKNEDAIIYVGANWCPWCRNIVNILFEAANDLNIKTVYYLNLDDEKSNYEVKDGKLVKTSEGTEGYYELLDFLKDNLNDYVITSGNKKYDTHEKRIYMPFVIACRDGEVVDTHTGSVTLDDNQTKYDALTEEQTKEVYDKYISLMKKIKDDSCNEGCD